jgi:cell division protein ZipA
VQPENDPENDTEAEPVDEAGVEEPAINETLVEEPTTESSEQDIPGDDVVALYIVADRGNELKGEQILSACFAGQLEYGDMKIFHRLDAVQNPVFSMANMMEPGWFDYNHMHELKTRGITLFTQLRLCDEPVQALDDMLVCAHTLGSLLNAQLCGPDRQLLNEVTAKSLREKARYFQQQKHGQP